MSNSVFGKVTLGADPEIFLVKPDGTPWGALTTGCKGTKEAPEPTEYGALQVDGLALEYNIHPVDTLHDWLDLHTAALTHIADTADKAGLVIDSSSRLDFTSYIDGNGATEDELLFGCDPDFNADTMEENTMPDNDGSIKFRTTGGHVHIGLANWGELHGGDDKIAHMMASKIIFVCDAILGLRSVLTDDGVARKELYGKAGAYRVKPYGVEYRTLSNFWLFDEAEMKFIFDALNNVFASDGEFERVAEFATLNRADIVKAINTNDKELAIKLLAGDAPLTDK
ncbi:hypothetical protein [Vibrio phage VpJYP1]|nr:hypothetical protein [Vibrio phage VpJYP1]